MISHEIRTPMNGILRLIELLQTTHLPAEQHRMVEQIGESGHALAQILDDILDCAKIEAARLTITHAPQDLCELFDGVLDALASGGILPALATVSARLGLGAAQEKAQT